MAIVAVCGNCSKRYTLDDEFAGKQVKCRTCKESFEVPGSDDSTLMADASPPGSDDSGRAKRRRTTTGKKKKPASKRETKPKARPEKDEDVLELRTEFAKRAAAPTIEEGREGSQDASTKAFDRATGRSAKGGGGGGRRRYKKKSRWLLKSFVALVVLLGLTIGAGAIFLPKNMALKWEKTKAFWGTGLVQWGTDMIAVDMELESAEAAVDDDTPDEPEGPPAGSAVTVRGVIVAVEAGTAGRDPSTFKVRGSNDVVYRIVLPDPNAALGDIKQQLIKDEASGPSVEVTGTLAKNPFDSKMTQVEQPQWVQKEPADIEGKEPFVVDSEPEGADEAEGADEDEGTDEDAGDEIAPGDEPGDGE